MSEKALWKKLKPYCPMGRYTRVENAEAGPGTPDVNYRIPAVEGWMELKEAPDTRKIPFPDRDKGLHQSQLDWIETQVAFGGKVLIVARIGKQILFIPGKRAPYFNGAPLKRLLFFAELVVPYDDIGSKIKELKQLLEKKP